MTIFLIWYDIEGIVGIVNSFSEVFERCVQNWHRKLFGMVIWAISRLLVGVQEMDETRKLTIIAV